MTTLKVSDASASKMVDSNNKSVGYTGNNSLDGGFGNC